MHTTVHTTLYVTHMSDEDVDVRLKVKEIIKQAPSRNIVGYVSLFGEELQNFAWLRIDQ